jgi:hypothetical protein
MRTRTVVACIAAAALTIGMAQPASAATSGVTAATVTVQGGFLSITVPTDAGSLGSRINTVSGGTISGPLGQVQVNDARSAFTPPAGPAIPASAISYTAGAITKTGTATYTADDPADLTGVVAAVTATGITGDNSATWNPTISVAVSGGTIAGVYSATITHSVV